VAKGEHQEAAYKLTMLYNTISHFLQSGCLLYSGLLDAKTVIVGHCLFDIAL